MPPRDRLADGDRQPHHDRRRHHAGASAAEPRADEVAEDGEAEGLGEVPAHGQQQPPRPGQLKVLSHGEEHTVASCSRAGIARRWRKEESESSARLYNVSLVT